MAGTPESGTSATCRRYNGDNSTSPSSTLCYSGFCGEYIVFNGHPRMPNSCEGSFTLSLHPVQANCFTGQLKYTASNQKCTHRFKSTLYFSSIIYKLHPHHMSLKFISFLIFLKHVMTTTRNSIGAVNINMRPK